MIFIKTLKNTTQKKRKILILFDDIIADMLICFIRQTIFAVLKNYQTKFNTLFHYENLKQARASKNRI